MDPGQVTTVGNPLPCLLSFKGGFSCLQNAGNCVCVFLRGYPFGAYKSTRSQSPQHALRSCNSNRGGFQESPLSSGPGSLARGKEINEDLAALWSHFRKFCGCTFLGAWAQRRCVFVGLGSDWPMSRPSGGNLCGAVFGSATCAGSARIVWGRVT